MSRREMVRAVLWDIEQIHGGNGFDELSFSPDLVSVIVPSYGHRRFIEECLRSIVDQSYPAIEVLLIDDGSSDGTFEAGLACLRASRRPFLAVQKKNSGAIPNANAGVLLSLGNWICLLASDDFFYPDKIARQVAVAREQEADVVFGATEEISEAGVRLGRARLPENADDLARLRGEVLRRRLGLGYQGWLISRRMFAKVGLLEPAIYTEDFDFTVRLLSGAGKIAILDEVAGVHRQRADRFSLALLDCGRDSFLKVIARHAASTAERRDAAANVLVQSAFNKLSYGYPAHALADAGRAVALAPLRATRTLAARGRHALGRRFR